MLGAASLSPSPPAGVAAVAPGIAAPFSPPWAPAPFSPASLAAGGVLGAAPSPWGPSTPDLLAPVVVEYISPSAIETATEELGGCLRKWAWAKLDRVPKTSGKAAELGSAMHAQHERYLEHGTPYDLTTRAGELAIATLHLLPAPGVAIVEQEFRVQVAALGSGANGEGAWLGGKVDANWSEDPAAAAASLAPGAPYLLPRRVGLGRRQIILDHKSTGDIRWAKLVREELLHHPQAPIYASFWWSSGRREVRVKNSKEWRAWDPGFVPNEIELRWNYVTTKGKPKAEPSWHVVEPDDVWAAFAAYVAPGAKRLLEIVQQANETRASGKPFGAMQLPANPSACGAFGGCQFRDRCGVSPLQGVRAMAEQSLAFLTKMGLAAAPAGQPIGLPAAVVEQPAPAPVAAPPAPIATSPIPAAAQAIAAPWMPPAAAQAAPVTAPAPAPAPFVAPAAASSAPVTQGYGSQINPPESALPVVQAAPVFVVTAPEQVAAVAETPAVSAEPAAPKKGPGRPRKNQTTPEIVTVAAGATAPDSDDEAIGVAAVQAIARASALSLHDRALIAVLPAAFEACKAAIFSGSAPPASALELARAVVAPLKEEAGK